MDTQESLTEGRMREIMLVTVGMTWKDLQEHEKATLHLVATWPGKSLKGTNAWEACKGLARPDGTLHSETARAVESLAAKWHRREGRI